MTMAFLNRFLENTGFQDRDRADTLAAIHKLGSSGFSELLAAAEEYEAAGYDTSLLNRRLDELSTRSGVHRYTLWLLVLIHCSEEPYGRCRDEAIFWDTFTDIRYKVDECRRLYGICGIFVGFWYPIFFRDAIVRLGRLEFETCIYNGSPLTSPSGISLNPGDTAYSIHIPSNGEAFDRAARLDSYRRAYEYFGCAERNVPLICFCESWLIYPPYTAVMPEHGTIRDFARDFCAVYGEETEIFDDCWRVFGGADPNAPAAWEEKTGLQRSLKGYFSRGCKPGFGMGLLIFDGKKLEMEFAE